MKTETFHVADQNGVEHEIYIEEYLPRFYKVYVDGVRDFSFSGSFLSIDIAFRTYCSEHKMREIQRNQASSGFCGRNAQLQAAPSEDIIDIDALPLLKTTNSVADEPGMNSSSGLAPADYLKTLAILHELLDNDVITRDEFETLKKKLISFFGERI